jgi:hypothetical protein
LCRQRQSRGCESFGDPRHSRSLLGGRGKAREDAAWPVACSFCLVFGVLANAVWGRRDVRLAEAMARHPQAKPRTAAWALGVMADLCAEVGATLSLSCIADANRMRLVLFVLNNRIIGLYLTAGPFVKNNRIFGLYLTAIDRILFKVMSAAAAPPISFEINMEKRLSGSQCQWLDMTNRHG